MKIDSCLIIKNEEQNIERLIKQLLMFSNEVHITDTGSTDNTINIVEEFSKSYSNVFLHYFEWCMDFAKARNYSLYCYECKADYQFWCDGDDELNDILINTLKNFEGYDDLYFINYLYSDNFTHFRTSLFKVSKHYKWNDSIHEYIDYEYDSLNYTYFNNGSLLIHHKDKQKNSLIRNLEIFRNMEKENYEFTSRNRFYYGLELYNNGFYEYATYQLSKCINIKDNNILDKVNACIYLFFINDDIGLEYFYKLFNIEYIRKDLLYYAAEAYYKKSNYILAKFFYLLCINCDEPEPNIRFLYKKDSHILSLFQLNLIEYYQFNNIDKSIYYNEEILKIEPNNEIALNNIKIINEIRNKNNE